MSPDSETERDVVGELLSKYLDLLYQVDKAAVDTPSEGRSINRIERDNTSRTTLRHLDVHNEMADRYTSTPYFRSRELFYGMCVEFARFHEDKFEEFLMDYIANEIREELDIDREEIESASENSSESSPEGGQEIDLDEDLDEPGGEPGQPSPHPQEQEPRPSEGTNNRF